MTQAGVEQHETARPRVGDVIGAKYRIVRPIGKGGMGEVYEAHHVQLDERVAVKMLLGALATSHEFKVRLLREAQATARIKNEHVVSVFDVGELPDGAPYIVMEYLEGEDLGNYDRGKNTRPVHETVDYVMQACEALAEAHVKGIVHRDLKPSNLFLTTRSDGTPCIKVLDFGISKIAESDDGLTGTNESIGTVRYMSPEQLRSSRDVDSRSDIWSMGVVLFELLTHELPFRSDQGGSLVLEIVGSPPRPLAELRTDLPRGLVDITLCCLDKDRDRRFESVSGLAVALAPFGTEEARRSCERIIRIAGAPSRTRVATSTGAVAHAPAPHTVRDVSDPRRAAPRHWLTMLVIGLSAVTLTTAIVVGVRARSERTTTVPAASAAPAPAPPPPLSATAASEGTAAESAGAAPSVAPSAAPSAAPASSTPASSSPPANRVVPAAPPRHPRPPPKPAGTVADDRHG
jgi:serine/threonine-protein kinase